ncbi:MAG TPA: hypothetical protein VNA32_02960, partial [Actinomycetota bacterium]|nr:hypothetical protein [Actinomycetota bacterium]
SSMNVTPKDSITGPFPHRFGGHSVLERDVRRDAEQVGVMTPRPGGVGQTSLVSCGPPMASGN